MDFDSSLSNIGDELQKLSLTPENFSVALKLVYRAYYVGKAEAWSSARQYLSEADGYMTIGQNSAIKNLA